MDPRETTYSARGSRWIKRIIVAADGSPASTEGVEQVVDLAGRLGAKGTVVFARHLPSTALMAPGDPSLVEALDAQEAEVKQQALRLLGGTGIVWDLRFASEAQWKRSSKSLTRPAPTWSSWEATATARCTTWSLAQPLHT